MQFYSLRMMHMVLKSTAIIVIYNNYESVVFKITTKTIDTAGTRHGCGEGQESEREAWQSV